MLVAPGSGELVDAASQVLELLDGDDRFKPELPASQLEQVTSPCETVAALGDQLARGRRDLVERTRGTVAFAAAGAHPTAPPEGGLSPGARYDAIVARYGAAVMRRQLVCALQVHVAPGSAGCALAVHNALRSYLPILAALAANAPYFEGRDTAMASVRPRICALLPRQGVPPPLETWDELRAALDWSAQGKTGSDWWWQLRPHASFGTLELRVPDTQTTVAEATAIAALSQCLVTWLAERHEAGETLPVDETWRIAENAWAAARDGVEAIFADPRTGSREPVREILGRLIAELEPVAAKLDCSAELERAGRMAVRNGALHQRRVAAELGPSGLVEWLSERFLK